MRLEWVKTPGSTCLRRVALEGDRGRSKNLVLHVHFLLGGYAAYRIPNPRPFDALLAARSRGSYYATQIRGKYPRADG